MIIKYSITCFHVLQIAKLLRNFTLNYKILLAIIKLYKNNVCVWLPIFISNLKPQTMLLKY